MADWMEAFARAIHAAKKYVVSSTLDRVDWEANLVHLGTTVRQMKRVLGARMSDPDAEPVSEVLNRRGVPFDFYRPGGGVIATLGGDAGRCETGGAQDDRWRCQVRAFTWNTRHHHVATAQVGWWKA
jgi:hypothetical protein